MRKLIPSDLPTGHELAQFIFDESRRSQSLAIGADFDAWLAPAAITQRKARALLAEHRAIQERNRRCPDAREYPRSRSGKRKRGEHPRVHLSRHKDGKRPWDTWLGRLDQFFAVYGSKRIDLSKVKMTEAAQIAHRILMMCWITLDPDADDRTIATEWQQLPWDKVNGELVTELRVFVDEGQPTDRDYWSTRRTLQTVLFGSESRYVDGESDLTRNFRAAWEWVKLHQMSERERKGFERSAAQRVAAAAKPRPKKPSADAQLYADTERMKVRARAATLDRAADLLAEQTRVLEREEKLAASKSAMTTPSPASSPKATSNRANEEPKYKRCQRRMLGMFKSNKLPASLRMTSRLMKSYNFDYNIVRNAALDDEQLRMHFHLGEFKQRATSDSTEPNVQPAPPERLLEELAGALVRQGMEKSDAGIQVSALKQKWKSGDETAKREVIETCRILTARTPLGPQTVPLQEGDGNPRTGRRKCKPLPMASDA